MKRRWVLTETIDDSEDGFWKALFPFMYVCKICGTRRVKKREIIFHISTKHSKWEKRGDSRMRENFTYYFVDKKPDTEAISIRRLF